MRQRQPLILVISNNRDIMRPLPEIAREWGWELRGLWTPHDSWPVDRSPAGAIVGRVPTGALARHLRETGCPAVQVSGSRHRGDNALPAVLQDLTAAGHLAAEHFASREFKQVAYVGYDPARPGANKHAMYIAFEQRASELGTACHLMSLRLTDRKGEPGRFARRTRDLGVWLKGLPKPLGVFTCSDIMALQVGLACASADLTIPEEVALLGYGNSLQCEFATVSLSSVDPAWDETMEVAMRLLRRLMKGEQGPKRAVMVPPAGVVERRSTNVLAVADPTVARALRFLWDHFDQDLSVDDVAHELGINRRKLERGFRRELGRTVGGELRRRRLAIVCEALRSTDDSIADIAARVGYRSAQYLHRVFSTAYGMTPRAYRLRGQ